MGNQWDQSLPSQDLWASLIKLVKPGAHMLAFGHPKTFHRLFCYIEDAGWEIRDCISWIHGQGFPKGLTIGDGQSTTLKPSWEPIVLARRPFHESVVVNIQNHGTGGLNIDRCRVQGSQEIWERHQDHEHILDNMAKSRGRWPSNVVFDHKAAKLLDEQSGVLGTCGPNPTSGSRVSRLKSIAGRTNGALIPEFSKTFIPYPDRGGASKFFYCAKGSRIERSIGCHDLYWDLDRNPITRDLWEQLPRDKRRRGNIHPTVHPVALLRWLCRLITPPGGLVLDPFCGSGSTGVAAAKEGLRFIGIDRDACSIKIASARIPRP